MNKTVILLVGLPCSGKSTLVKNLTGVTVISSDAIIQEEAKLEGVTYNDIFEETIGSAIEQANEKFKDAMEAETPFIFLDQTNLTAKSRARKIKKAKDAGYQVDAWYMHIGLDDVYEWNARLDENRNGKQVPMRVVHDMMNREEMPQVAEGFTNVYIFDINGRRQYSKEDTIVEAETYIATS